MNFWLMKREKMGISQFELAVIAGVTPSTIGNWERDISVPPLSRAAKLAEVFGETREKIEKEIIAQSRRIEATTPA